MSTHRPDPSIPGTGTTPTTPPTPAGGPPLTSPPDELHEATWSDDRSSESGNRTTDASREVAGHARSEVEDATRHAAEQGKHVAETAKSEVRDVVDEARDAVRQQADRQSEVVAGAIARLRDDLEAMSEGHAPRDATADYLHRAASSLDDVVDRLEQEGIEGALSGMRRFAQRSPGGFLLASAGAGFAVARLLRNADHPQQVTEQRASTTSEQQRDREIDLTGNDPGRVEATPRHESVGREIRR